VREYGGCVLHERYDTGKGYSGESLNVYDAARKTGTRPGWTPTARCCCSKAARATAA
jgi:hypothetical protein